MRYLSRAKPKELAGAALVRLDFNTEDEWRMEATLPTLRLLMQYAAKIVIVSHRGRPEGFDKKLSLAPDAKHLERYLKRKVLFIPDTHFATIALAIARAPRRSIILLENLRFWPGEETNDEKFAHSLAGLAHYYVNDAFPVCHRPAASIVAITKFLPSYAGLVLEKEIEHLSHVAEHPKHPLVLILGGGKAHDKLGVVKYFEHKADAFLLGGAPANSILKLRGVKVGKSKIDQEVHDHPMLKRLAKSSRAVVPLDWRTEKKMIVDIGPKTEKLFAEHIKSARTIIWSGPIGLIEKKKFSRGNLAVAKAIAANKNAFTVTGGGETVMFLKKYKLDRKFSFVSTGGTAMLDVLAGEQLPGIAALQGEPRQGREALKNSH